MLTYHSSYSPAPSTFSASPCTGYTVKGPHTSIAEVNLNLENKLLTCTHSHTHGHTGPHDRIENRCPLRILHFLKIQKFDLNVFA